MAGFSTGTVEHDSCGAGAVTTTSVVESDACLAAAAYGADLAGVVFEFGVFEDGVFE